MKNAKWWAALAAASVLVGATVAAGVVVSEKSQLYYEPAPSLAPAAQLVVPATGVGVNAESLAQVAARFDDPRLGQASIQIRNTHTGEVVLSHRADEALLPASTTKVLTAAAALLKLGEQDRVATRFYAPDSSTVVIKAAGDVGLRAADINEVAQKIKKAVPDVSAVLVDASIWSAPETGVGWDLRDIDGGYIAPMQPVMIDGGRIGASEGDVPRSHTPALDVAKVFAERLGVSTFGMTNLDPENQGREVAVLWSDTLEKRLTDMMAHSDNVIAEAIGRELDPAQPVEATLNILAEHFDTSGVNMVDNSGLSLDNRIPARLLDEIFYRAATDLTELRPLLAQLPVAGGTGTLAPRYHDLAGRGWVRAKTGTLTDIASLAGIIHSESGAVYSFAMICNGAEVLGARQAMDEITSDVRTLG
ncbi:D-alanyl-D-alanine carboxypeptidase/D-alanyl-D-alanine-endopeptidase [Corynebacterium felinum]|uniref:D-alanyl-D-alanine carboxypeptidase/D-alanyl-D-alanine-endopeptidase (Penicillin-binding protein 4) n=1 Tax=Corynebacterium felinum TaxID=131318 RepID=A0ABU2B5G6_9CORY|nr:MULTISPECIES: D-alanyl-D-alanine carboxypeptidase/D-alanyl-D-alanine-endopeptidase [Corynebacterium]MDF5820112.1 D-alanyl-D-alanine carboxypeptidase/D-alanyl-D-alanine-endopeptidase [Corynebacterium felinum]MDO4762576.1 D-alanyl-D-alanine carboxypeptidase/D-alanyl-D-alanine-endopeptidase [Corynebacterium sp.]MDR7353858.1 D-alanyl-D-alanine carboxypeptidase/D-alanyl-D-alanine-endopeptidase (penicillin-binding protein 4) [Corynebacterium felinum]WJY96033.1 D-alanyl-D-alanine carboxypeptidase D